MTTTITVNISRRDKSAIRDAVLNHVALRSQVSGRHGYDLGELLTERPDLNHLLHRACKLQVASPNELTEQERDGFAEALREMWVSVAVKITAHSGVGLEEAHEGLFADPELHDLLWRRAKFEADTKNMRDHPWEDREIKWS